ncbi:NAD(+)/NADH kinase [Halobacteriaceae archaeon GCM10025711]
MPAIGLVVNPSAGRDIRRLTGSAVVSDNYAKRQTARCVLAGLAMTPGVEAVVMPDKAGLGQWAVENAPDGVAARLLDVPVAGSSAGTQRAAARFSETVDVVVVLGGDGTNRDVALEIGDVPMASVSTGTNNVVPVHVDGTAAGAAAGLVAAGVVPVDDVTFRHGMVEAAVDARTGERTLRGLATLGVIDRPFVGTRAVLHGDEFVGGVVSRAHPSDIGLSGIAGAVEPHAPDAPGGVALHLGPPAESPTVARAITVPGVVERIGVREHLALADDETTTFEVAEAVLSVDGERDLEVQDAVVDVRPVPDGPRVVRFDDVFTAASATGRFVE